MTSLRLQAEKISDPGERDQLVAQLDRLESAVDDLIVSARIGADAQVGHCVLDVVVADRTAFWGVLAQEQSRDLRLAVGAPGVALGVSRESVEAMIDALIGNVFDHTAPGTNLTVKTGETAHRPWLEVGDEGQGFPDISLQQRGISGRGSTGLGLDIVKRTAEMTGGTIEIANTGSGSTVRVWFG